MNKIIFPFDKVMELVEFNRANNIANVEAMFRSFANRLRNAMDKVHGK